MKNIILVEPDGIFAEALKKVLIGQFNVLTPHSNLDAVNLARLTEESVALVSTNASGFNDLVGSLSKLDDCSVIATSFHNDESFIKNAVKYGARAYILREKLANQVNDAIENISKYGFYYNETLNSKMLL